MANVEKEDNEKNEKGERKYLLGYQIFTLTFWALSNPFLLNLTTFGIVFEFPRIFFDMKGDVEHNVGNDMIFLVNNICWKLIPILYGIEVNFGVLELSLIVVQLGEVNGS